MNRLSKVVYTQEFQDQAVKMVLTDSLSASTELTRAPTVLPAGGLGQRLLCLAHKGAVTACPEAAPAPG